MGGKAQGYTIPFLSLAKASGSGTVLGWNLYLVQPDQPDQTRGESFVSSTMSPSRHSKGLFS